MTRSEQWTGLLLLFFASIPPLIYPVAQAGYASMADLGIWALLPSVVIFLMLALRAEFGGMDALMNRVLVGAAAGLLATSGLEIVRSISFHFGGMPGSLPELLGVLLTGRIMEGPDGLSDLAGYAYHYWNGLCFGVIYSVLFGHRHPLWGVVYGVVIGVIFLASPAVSAMGIGFMGREMPSMPMTVILAHLVFGTILGVLARRWLWKDQGFLLALPKDGEKAVKRSGKTSLGPWTDL